MRLCKAVCPLTIKSVQFKSTLGSQEDFKAVVLFCESLVPRWPIRFEGSGYGFKAVALSVPFQVKEVSSQGSSWFSSAS